MKYSRDLGFAHKSSKDFFEEVKAIPVSNAVLKYILDKKKGLGNGLYQSLANTFYHFEGSDKLGEQTFETIANSFATSIQKDRCNNRMLKEC